MILYDSPPWRLWMATSASFLQMACISEFPFPWMATGMPPKRVLQMDAPPST